MGVTIALIQPIHGQGYNSDIPRPDAPVIYIGAFPILTAQPGRMSIYNTFLVFISFHFCFSILFYFSFLFLFILFYLFIYLCIYFCCLFSPLLFFSHIDSNLRKERAVPQRAISCISYRLRLIGILSHLSCDIMAEGFRFMPLGLVRLRTFRLCARVT